MSSPAPGADHSNTKTEDETTAFCKKRRMSFPENTSVHIFDPDDESATPPNFVPYNSPSEELGFGDRDSDSRQFFRNEDDDGPISPFIRVAGSPSSGGTTSVASATSNDDDTLFGPVNTSFIRPDLSHSAASDDNDDQTMDSTAFSMHFRSIARSESDGDPKTLSIEEKTPKTGVSMPSNTRPVSMTLVKKPNSQPDDSNFKLISGAESNEMSLDREYDYGKLSPGINAFLKEGDLDMHMASRKSPIKAGKQLLANTENGPNQFLPVYVGPDAPAYAGSEWNVVQDFGKPSNSSVSDETNKCLDPSLKQNGVSSTPPVRLPFYHASELGPCCAVISYEACVRLCLKYWSLGGSSEARVLLENDCSLLRNAFCLEQVLLQPEDELLNERSSKVVVQGVFKKPRKTTRGKLKVQVRKVKMGVHVRTGCAFPFIQNPLVRKLQTFNQRLSSMKTTMYSEWKAALQRDRVARLVKVGITSLNNASTPPEEAHESYICSMRLKSSTDEDVRRMQPGSTESHIFLPDDMKDDLVIEVTESKGKYCGHGIAQLADIADDTGEKLRWWPLYHEPEHERVGRIQLHINYSTTSRDENSNVKCGMVAETIAYDSVLEAAMKVEKFQQRNLLLCGPWKWLVTRFATYYGVSDAYTKLRYLQYVMDVATPTADCLNIVLDLLSPVMTGKSKGTLSSQENRMLRMLSDQIEQLIALVFENYKSLDESGLTTDTHTTHESSPALKPALKLYALLHDDILLPEARLQLCKYFQTAVRKILGRHLAETNEVVVSSNGEKSAVAYSTAYQKMKSLCLSIREEIVSDIQIHKQDVLPSFLELPDLSSSLYSYELCNRIRKFLVACPPISLSHPVTDLIITTYAFQRDLVCWKISPVKGGVDTKALFHMYITHRINDKHLELLEACKRDKGVGPQDSMSTFVDDMYKQLKETFREFEVILRLWPDFTLVLEKVIADSEREIMETLEKQYISTTLKENNTILFKAVQYAQRLATGNALPYTFPEELGTVFNSMKKMLDVLQPEIENRFKAYISKSEENTASSGELLNQVTLMLRTKFKYYLQAAVDKLVGNTRLQNTTNLKKVIHEAKDVGESGIRNKMKPLKDLLTNIISDLHGFLEVHVFIIFCRALWDQMGKEMLWVLENRKETWSSYKASRDAISILNETFASEMQRLVGHTLDDKDMEPPRSIIEVQSMLCK